MCRIDWIRCVSYFWSRCINLDCMAHHTHTARTAGFLFEKIDIIVCDSITLLYLIPHAVANGQNGQAGARPICGPGGRDTGQYPPGAHNRCCEAATSVPDRLDPTPRTTGIAHMTNKLTLFPPPKQGNDNSPRPVDRQGSTEPPSLRPQASHERSLTAAPPGVFLLSV